MMFKKIVFVGSALALFVAIGFWVLKPSEVLASGTPCMDCGSIEVIDNVSSYGLCDPVELRFVFPSPCPDQDYDVTGGGMMMVPCSSGDCGNHCAIGVELGPHGFVDFSGPGGTWTLPSACCPSGLLEITITPIFWGPPGAPRFVRIEMNCV